MKKTSELIAAEKDLKEKVYYLLTEINKQSREKFRKYCRENTYAQEEHLKELFTWGIAKDFVVALLEEAAFSHSNVFGTKIGIRKSKKNIRTIRSKIYGA